MQHQDDREQALRALRAVPIDDEPDTEQERAEAAEARAEYDRDGGISSSEARRRLG